MTTDRAPTATESEPRAVEGRVALVVGGLHTEGSGVARIVCELANAYARRGEPVDVVTVRYGDRSVAAHMLDERVRLRALPGRGAARLGWSPALGRYLSEHVRDYSVVHNQSLWMLPNHYAARSARRWGVPTVFTIHGFLEDWAVRRAAWKKRVVGWWFQDRDLRRATCLHVNSEAELATVRSRGLRGPVAVVPNGVPRGVLDEGPGPAAFHEAVPAARGRRVCLFLSRLHEKKGLLLLLEAWARLSSGTQGWHLVLAGPDDGLGREVAATIRRLGLGNCVSVPGALYGPVKRSAYGAADLFVLPSYSEGFSMALLEALGSGLPVLCTPGCNFPEVEASGAGLEVAAGAEAVEAGLARLMGMSPEERGAMGAAGRRMVESRYTWDHVAESMDALYGWLRGRRDRPSFVDV